MKNIDLYYFSGTGNTLLAAQAFEEEVSKYDYAVNLIRMEKADPAALNSSNIIGLAFPVAVFTTYPFVWNFIKALPKVSGTKVFMIATMGGSSFGLVGKLKSVLAAKGFDPVGAHQAIMPTNIFTVLPEEKNKRIRDKGLNSVRIFALRFVQGSTKWHCVPLFSKLAYYFYAVCTATWKIKFLQKRFNMKLDGQRCIKCGVCAKLCPVNNIKMTPAGPVFGLSCQYCMRCISYCPAKAINSKFLKNSVSYKATDLPYKE